MYDQLKMLPSLPSPLPRTVWKSNGKVMTTASSKILLSNAVCMKLFTSFSFFFFFLNYFLSIGKGLGRGAVGNGLPA